MGEVAANLPWAWIWFVAAVITTCIWRLECMAHAHNLKRAGELYARAVTKIRAVEDRLSGSDLLPKPRRPDEFAAEDMRWPQADLERFKADKQTMYEFNLLPKIVGSEPIDDAADKGCGHDFKVVDCRFGSSVIPDVNILKCTKCGEPSKEIFTDACAWHSNDYPCKECMDFKSTAADKGGE